MNSANHVLQENLTTEKQRRHFETCARGSGKVNSSAFTVSEGGSLNRFCTRDVTPFYLSKPGYLL